MKGVILAGGFGTRLRPFTKRLNKGMAPLYTPEGAIPQLLYPLNTLVSSGIKEVLIITSREHCGHIVELLGDGEEYGCHLTYKIQEMDRPVVGIAQALGLAKDFVGKSEFAVILGDNFYEDNFEKEFLDFGQTGGFSGGAERKASIFLKRVHDPERFGVATLDATGIVKKIIEKPEEPESDYAVTGLYLYTSHVFELIPHLKPSGRNELEITDINSFYVDEGLMIANILDGFWHDMGLPESAKAVQDFLWSKNAILPQ